MGRYFGHRSKWQGGTKHASPIPPQMPQAPMSKGQLTVPPHSGHRRSGVYDGQVIPPNRGQYPRGHSVPSVPGTARPSASAMAAYGRMMQTPAGRRRLAGLLGKLARRLFPALDLLLQLDAGFQTLENAEWYEGQGEWTPGSTWIRCPSPTQSCQDTWSPPTVYRFLSSTGTSCTSHSACAEAQSYDPASARPAGSPVPNGWNRIRFYTKTAEADAFGNEKGTIMAQYRRTVTGVVPSPFTPGKAAPLPNVYAPPVPVGSEKTYPRSRPRPAVRPYERPAVQVVSGRGSKTPTPVKHRDLPPGPNTRERKQMAVPKAAKDILNAITEGMDWVECLYKSLPKHVTHEPVRKKGGRVGWRKKFANPVDKAQALWEHWDQMDPATALWECAKNQAEDALFGKLGQARGATGRGAQPSQMPDLGQPDFGDPHLSHW